MKAIKITNANWLGYIAPRIAELVKKLALPALPYEALYAYLAQSVQHTIQVAVVNASQERVLQDMSELWVVLDDEEEPVGFAHWYVKGLPYVGTVMCDFAYSWGKNSEIFRLLLDEFEQFGLRHRATIYECEAINEAAVRLYTKAAKAKGYSLTVLGTRHCVMRRD